MKLSPVRFSRQLDNSVNYFLFLFATDTYGHSKQIKNCMQKRDAWEKFAVESALIESNKV